MRCTFRKESSRIVGSLALMLIAIVAAPGQSRAGSFEVSGVVLDPNGAVIAGATIVLRRDGMGSGETQKAGQSGEFRFFRIASGDYQIEAQKEGFKPNVTQLTVGAKSPSPLTIVLAVVDVREEISVGDRPNQVNTSPDENLNVIKVDQQALGDLPILGNDVLGSVASLLDAGSIGSDGPTIIIDGLESSKNKVPASTIQEVRINQNPYSAEFARLGRARIEVFTKPGSSQYHGEMNFLFRDHRLDARNAFALERPPEQRRYYDGNLGGPLGNGKTTSFFLAVNREEDDLQSVVFASTPGGLVSENVATPHRDTEISFRINHQIDKKTSFSIRYESQFDSTGNSGVGGFILPEAAADSSGHEIHLFVTLRSLLSPSLVNEFTMRAGNEGSLTRSVNAGARFVVLDAFTGGGGQTDRRTTENHVQLNEILSWNHGKHFVRGGLNIPDISRRGFSDRSDFGGTFSFSTLADYLDNRPFLFSITRGDGHLAFLQKDFGLFVQDNILVQPNLSVGVGLRYDRQSYLGDNNNFAPRLSFAYAPDKKRKTVIRGGVGIFYDRTGIGPIADRLRFDGQRLLDVSISNPSYPDPFSSGGTLATQPSNIVRFAPDIREPYIIQSGLGVERQITKSLTATANYINTRGIKLYRSRDINAPLPPFLERPDPAIGILRQIESSAHSQAHALELMLRGKISRFFNGTIQYTLGRVYNDTSGINSRPADNHDLTGEWSRADFDERHRFNLLGTIKAGEWFNLGMTLALTSGRPYSLTTGRDDNRDSLAIDRPAGVPRNSLQGPGAATLDVRWAKEFRLKETQKKEDRGPTITFGIAAFNVLNRTNYAGFVGNLSSPFFGLPVASRPARRTQLTLGFKF